MGNKEEKGMVDPGRNNFEAGQYDEVNFYDYWKVFIKRKIFFIIILIGPLAIATIISLSQPRYYRGESEMSIFALPAPNIVNFIGDIDDTKKNKMFANHSGAIESVVISVSKTSNDKISTILKTKTPDIIPQAFKELFDYINTLPEIKKEISKKQEENDFKIRKAKEVKAANLIFLEDMTEMIKKRQLPFITINPADLVKKDADLEFEIMSLENVKIPDSKLAPPLIIEQPTGAQRVQIIIITGILSLLTVMLGVFLFEYMERMKHTKRNKVLF